MMKALTIAGASLLLLGTLANPVLAASGGDGNNSDRHQYLQDLQDECQALITQFDKAKSSDAAAVALRNKAWDNCVSNETDGATAATHQMRQALKMIGVQPKVM